MIENIHSVYNQPSIYNGGGGEIITNLPDIAVNGKIFKNFFPLRTFSDAAFVDSDFVLNNDIAYSNPFVLFNRENFFLGSNDSFEIQFTFKKIALSNQNCTIFGSCTDFFNNLTLEVGGDYLWFGVPRSTSPNAWSGALNVSGLSINSDTWYTAKVVCSGGTITAFITDDFSEKSNSVSANNLYANSPLQLMGINRSQYHHFNGSIDLKSSYIKKNGVLVWGIE